jgi:integrase
MRGSLRERSKGVWELRVYAGKHPITGKKQAKSRTFRGGRRAAELELRRLIADVEADRVPVAASGTVEELAGEWLATIERSRSPMTVQRYRGILYGHILPALGSMRVAAVSTRTVEAHLAASAKTLAPSTVNQHRAVLSGMFQAARRWGLVDRDPVRDVPREPLRQAPRDVLPPDAVRRLLDTVMEADELQGTLLRVMAATGMRRGEAVGLQWSDLDGDRLHVRRAVVEPVGGPLVVKDPKTHRVRAVTLDAGTVAAIEDHRAACERLARLGGVRPGPWMFSLDEGQRVPLRPSIVSRWWRRWADRGGVGGRLHDVRHLHASFLLAEGVDPVEVAARLGHGSTATTLAVYAHVLPGRDGGSAAAAAKMLD